MCTEPRLSGSPAQVNSQTLAVIGLVRMKREVVSGKSAQPSLVETHLSVVVPIGGRDGIGSTGSKSPRVGRGGIRSEPGTTGLNY